MRGQRIERREERTDSPSVGWKALKLAIRICVSAGVVAFLLARTGLAELSEAIAGVELEFLLVALGLAIAVVVVSGARWHVYLRRFELLVPLPAAIRLFFVGTFFNAFLPTGIGGDAYKVVRLRRADRSLSDAISSVLLDRLAGLAGLVILGALALLVRTAMGDRTSVVTASAVVVAGALGAAILVAFADRLLGRWRKPVGRWLRLRGFLETIAMGWRDPRTLAPGVGLGTLSQSMMLGVVVALARSLGLELSVASLLLVLLLVTVAATIPLSINGLGIREGVWAWGLIAYGAPMSDAVALGLLFLGVSLASSLAGGVVYAVRGGEIAAKGSQASPSAAST